MQTTVYKIDGVYDKDRNKKENQYIGERWFIKYMGVGISAVLIDFDSIDRVLTTSEVESVQILDNAIKFVTKNTEYWLKPYVEEV